MSRDIHDNGNSFGCSESSRINSFDGDITCSQQRDFVQSTTIEEVRSNEYSKYLNDKNLFLEAARIGRNLQKLGMLQDALRYYGQALRLKSKTIETEPTYIRAAVSDILYCIGEIHMVSMDSEDHVKCIHAFDLCLELRRYCFGQYHMSIVLLLYKFAEFYMKIGDNESALSLLLEALSVLLYMNEKESMLVDVWKAVAKVQKRLGRYDDAESSIMEANNVVQFLTMNVTSCDLEKHGS